MIRKKLFLLLTLIGISFVVVVPPSFSQTLDTKAFEKEKFQKQTELKKWYQLSEQLTSDLQVDIKSDSFKERPLILAQLAEIWWGIDNNRSKKWLKVAVNEVTFEPITETSENKNQRLNNAIELLKFVYPLDVDLADKLTESILKEENSTKDGKKTADELVATSLKIIKFDHNQAKRIGSDSLKYGQSYNLYRLIGELNLNNSNLAEELFDEALINAKLYPTLDSSLGFLSTLSYISFNSYKGKTLSETSKKKFLQYLYEVIFNSNLAEEGSCKHISTATGVIQFYEIYFPDKAVTLREKVRDCNLGVFEKSIETTLSDEKLQSVDEYLQFAKETKDLVLKKKYFHRAIDILYRKKAYEQITNILDEMTEEDIEAFDKDNWRSWRIESASQAAQTFLKEKEISDAYRIINKTPKSLQAFVQVEVAGSFKETDRTFAIAILEDARKNLDKYESKPHEKANIYLSIVRQYSDIASYDALTVFEETTFAINESDEANPNNNPLNDYALLKPVVKLPINLISLDEINFFNILSKIKSNKSRVRLRLGFLEQSIKKYEKSLEELSKLDSIKPKE